VVERDAVPLGEISAMLKRDEVYIEVVLGDGPYAERVWGCDLTEGYIDINARYTT
jgi:glutamate N-acetyltransferase/amino-acid N-acetyltransferase